MPGDTTCEALFYHLTERPLEAALPDLLEKCVERSWRVTLRAGSPERVAALDALLWTYREDAFLPHGTAADGRAARQPVYLTDGPETPNDPFALFLVDGARPEEGAFSRFRRVVALFDGHDEEAVAEARGLWREAVAAGAKAVYWAQGPGGRWVRKAESG
ncbi:MAG: DNA polymerase III subunit chi [Rhodobacteraceae bacterium]|nr:MAG: DNA polymerase III subunit chi [Paracoccaceae bacterium]